MSKHYSVVKTKHLLNVADLIIRTIGSTFGPKGRTIMIHRKSGLLSTKDGQTVLWELHPENSIERMILNTIQEASSRINKEVGDGTTTSALFTAFLLKEAVKWREGGASVEDIRKDFEEISVATRDGSFDFLSRFVDDEKDLYEIALSASNYDEELAQAVSKALIMGGSQGLVSVETGIGRGLEVIQKPGYEWDKGYESLDLTNNRERHFDECLVALVDATLTKVEEVAPILEEATQFPFPLLIVSRGLFSHALKTVVMNDGKLEKTDGSKFQVCASRVPRHPDQMGSFLEDLRVLTGATLWAPGLMPFESGFLGSAKEAHVGKDTSRILAFPDREGDIFKRCHVLRGMERRVTEFEHDADFLNKRISMLGDGLIVLKVGGASKTERREREARVEDTLFSVRSCVEGGVVPGSLRAYLELYRMIESRTPGKQIIREACRNLVWALFRSSGREPSVIVDQISTDPWEGYDLRESLVRDLWDTPKLVDPYEGFLRTIQTSLSVVLELIKLQGAVYA